MPLLANALTNLAAVKEYLKIDATDTSQDNLLEGLINASSNAIENYCNSKLKEQTITEEYDGTSSSNLFLNQMNLSSITSISIDGVTVDASEYKFRRNGIVVRLNSVWPRGILNTNVTYKAGFATVPPDLELACKHLVNFYYKTEISDFSRTFGDGMVIRPEAWPVQVKALLSPYKKVLV
jgi:hypothetical protein